MVLFLDQVLVRCGVRAEQTSECVGCARRSRVCTVVAAARDARSVASSSSAGDDSNQREAALCYINR